MTDTHGAYQPVIRACSLSDKASDLFPRDEEIPHHQYSVGDPVQVKFGRFGLDKDEEPDWSTGVVSALGVGKVKVQFADMAMWREVASPDLRHARVEDLVMAPAATSFTVTRTFLEDVRSLLSQRLENRVEVLALVLMKVDDLIGPVVPEPKTAQQVIAEGIVRSDYHHPPVDGQVESYALLEGYQDQARSVLSALESAGFQVLHAGGKVSGDDG